MDNNLLSGLGNLGLSNLEGLSIFEDSKETKAQTEKAEGKTVEIKEEDMLFDKSFNCPVCDRDFKSKMVRAGRAKAMSPDMDLRPRHEGIDTLKYDIVACPYCGYAGMPKEFPYLTAGQKKAIRENICSGFKPKPINPGQQTYSYEEAIERHKLALVNTIVKHGKDSEKAYICLKTGWLMRGLADTFDSTRQDYLWKKYENEKAEKQFLRNAYDGFVKARASEPFPLCGMDMLTVDYLLTALAVQLEEYDTAAKLLGGILTSKDANARIKDKALELKAVLMEKTRDRRS